MPFPETDHLLLAGPRPPLFLIYSLIIHSSMNLFFSQYSRQFIFSFSQVLRHEKLFLTVLTGQNMLFFFFFFFFANIPVNKHPSTSEVVCRCRSTYEGCDLVPLVTSSTGDSELIIHFQGAKLFSNCYNKQNMQSNLPSYIPNNQGTICAKVYHEGVQPTKKNNCGLLPITHLISTYVIFVSALMLIPGRHVWRILPIVILLVVRAIYPDGEALGVSMFFQSSISCDVKNFKIC